MLAQSHLWVRKQRPSTRKLQLTTTVQWGLVILVALMPFHAFLSVWLGSLTGHQAIIQAWKEVLLLLLTLLGCVLVTRDSSTSRRLRSWPAKLTFLFIAIAATVTLVTGPSLTAVAFGAKTDLEFLVAFLLAIITTTATFTRTLIRVILISATIVIGFGLLQSTLLPPNFLVQFGYGPHTIPPYLGLDPAVSSLRFGSTLGGPNQLGTYLMLPLALASLIAFRQRQWWLLGLVAGGGIVLIHTYSRSAWLGAAIAGIMVVIILTPTKLRLTAISLMGLLGTIGAWLVTTFLKPGNNLQYYLLHSNLARHGLRGSDREHLTSLQDGLSASLSQPLGHGLGTAGPATLRTIPGPIIENNYLQFAYETGLPGAAVFIALVGSVAWNLGRLARQHVLAGATLAALAGISTAALVLPAWTDSTTALTVWIAAGSIIGLTSKESNHV